MADNLRNFKLTVEEINQFIKTFFDPDEFVMVQVVPEESE